MANFVVLFIYTFQFLHNVFGARLPEVQSSKLDIENIQSRNPKVLLGTTTTITSTLTTSTLCYTDTGVAISTACDRRKRAISDGPIEGYEADSELVLPSSRKLFTDEEEADLFIEDALKSQKDFEGMNLNQIKDLSRAGRQGRSNGEKPGVSLNPEPRFLGGLYLYTSTITNTATSYSKTYTLTISSCTPAAGLIGLIPNKCG